MTAKLTRIVGFALECNHPRTASHIASRVSRSCIASSANTPSQLLINLFCLCKQVDFNTSLHLNDRRAYEVCFHPNMQCVYGNNKHCRYLKTKSCLLALCDQISARNFVLQTCLQQFWFSRLNLEWTVAINCNVTKSSFIKPSLIELTRFLIESVGKILHNEE